MRIARDEQGPRLIFATGFGGDQEWAVYSVALGRKGRGGVEGKPKGATLDGYTSVEGPLPEHPRHWGATTTLASGSAARGRSIGR